MQIQTDVEKLRDIFLKRAIESYGLAEKVEWTPGQMAWEIANFLPSFYGLARAARDNANPHRVWDQETLMFEVKNFGFPSAQALFGALDQIRESLKSELSEEDWGIFFKSTLDIA